MQTTLTDEQIIAIRNKVGERYNSAAHVSDSGAIEFARALLDAAVPAQPTQPQPDRNAVLEEAAALCDAIFKARGGVAFPYAAQEIRALKSAQPQQVEGAAPTHQGCSHSGERIASWDWITCGDCGEIHTSGADVWGVAANKWFKDKAEAEFFKINGRLPECHLPAGTAGLSPNVSTLSPEPAKVGGALPPSPPGQPIDSIEARTEKIRLSTANQDSKGKIQLKHEVECLLAHIALLKSSAPPTVTSKPGQPEGCELPPQKNWRKMLTDIGGWDNGMVSVPASCVREIIEEVEALRAALAARQVPTNHMCERKTDHIVQRDGYAKTGAHYRGELRKLIDGINPTWKA